MAIRGQIVFLYKKLLKDNWKVSYVLKTKHNTFEVHIHDLGITSFRVNLFPSKGQKE